MHVPFSKCSAVVVAVVVSMVAPACRDTTKAGGGPSSEAGSTPRLAETASQTQAGAETLSHKKVDEGLQVLVAAGEHWYGTYMGDKKVGHGVIRNRLSSTSEPGAWAVLTEFHFNVSANGRTTKMKLTEGRFYGGVRPYRLVASTFSQTMGDSTDVRQGRLQQGAFHITRTVGGVVQPEVVVPDITESLTGIARTMPKTLVGVKVGDSGKVDMFNWQLMAQEVISFEIKRVERMRRAGVDTLEATVSSTLESMNITMVSRVSEMGVALEMSLGPGLRMKLEDRQVATSNIVGLDVLGSGVKVSKKLGDPRLRKFLRLKVGIRSDGKAAAAVSAPNLPSSPAQRITRAGDKLMVTLTSGPGSLATPQEQAKGLKPDDVMDSSHPRIVAQAKKVTGGATTDAERVSKLVTYVFGAVEKRLATHYPSASMVLDKLVGDCTEHTWLFVALARAAGVSARPAYGVAYIGDGHQSFGYHAWAEVVLDGRWVAVDPTWNEQLADATHLKLGDELYTLGGLMGALTIEVLADDAVADKPLAKP